MKKIIIATLFLMLAFAGYSQSLTVTTYRDSTGRVSAKFKGSEGVIIHDGEYTVIDALRDCDSAHQVQISKLKKQIAALKKKK